MEKQKGKERSGAMTMKLLVDKSKNKVLFAEAEKECVDFIFSLLAMPVGALVRNLNKDYMDGSLGNVYNSFSNLRRDYMLDNVSKSCLLEPQPAAACSSAWFPLLTLNLDPGILKPRGYVKGAVTYMITDDLIVEPLSTISTVTLLNKFNAKHMGSLEERVVNLDWNKGVSLVFNSFASRTVLTDAYLGRKRPRAI